MSDDSLAERLLGRCTFPPPGTQATVAFSGGPDSSALLCLAARAGLDVDAVHVHHGLRASADDEAERARDIAQALSVPIRIERIALADGPNLEARARDARRSVIGSDAMTGHTADDQAETTLLAILRGAGARGVAAMRPGPRHPILGLRRAETEALCVAADLRPVDDPTNTSIRFRRNRIRHDVMPLLAEIAERDVAPLLARTADLLRDDDDLLEDLADQLDPADAAALAAAPRPLARRAIRRWLAVGGLPPGSAAVERVLSVASGDAVRCDVDRGRRVARTAGRLRVETTSSR